MAGKKTSAEQSKEEQKDAHVGNLLNAAFGDLGGLQKNEEELTPTPGNVAEETQATPQPSKPSGPPPGPSAKPPSGPPSGPLDRKSVV